MSESEAPRGELLLYQTDDGRTRIDCRFVAEESARFPQGVQRISRHFLRTSASGSPLLSGGGGRGVGVSDTDSTRTNERLHELSTRALAPNGGSGGGVSGADSTRINERIHQIRHGNPRTWG